LFGISKLDNYTHFMHQQVRIDYTQSVENYRETVFSYFERLGYTVDVYFATNDLEEADRAELVRHYNPKAHRFVPDVSSDKVQCRNIKLGAVVDLCIESNVEYEVVLVTRFDLHFNKRFEDSDLRFDRLNLVSVLESGGVVCDNFYLMPFSFLPAFADLIKEWGATSYHFIGTRLKEKFGEVHFILNEGVNVASLSFYKIVRSF